MFSSIFTAASGVSDVIKDKFLEEFSEVSLAQAATAFGLSFILSAFIVFIYWLTHNGVTYNKRFATGLVLLSIVTSLVVLAISSNVVLSLGMVGALSIVRFRTAVKDPIDTIFMFWAIVTGIITGAGFTYIAIFATIVAGLVYIAVTCLGGAFKSDNYMVMLRYAPDAAEKVEKSLSAIGRYTVKSRNMTSEQEDMVISLKLKEAGIEKLKAMLNEDGVSEVNIITGNGGTML